MSGRDRIILVAVVSLVLVVGSWVAVIQPKRDQASKLGTQISTAQTALNTARGQVVAGEAAKSSYAQDYAQIARLGEAVPSDDNVPSLIYQLQNAASSTGVDFRVLKLNPAASSGPVTTPTTTAAGASMSQASTATLPPGAAVGPAGFPTLPFTFTFRGNFFHLSDFFGRLDKFVSATNKNVSVSGRLMTVNSISLAPGPSGFPQIDAIISATTFLVPASQGLLNGATPSGPSTASTTQASATGGSVPASAAAVTP
jgi:hypothetical protein